jgi:hypothetical protein
MKTRHSRPGAGRSWSVVLGLVGSAWLTASAASAATPGCATPPNGLISWWRAEGNAEDAVDGNHGALLNGVRFTNGVAGQAFSFDGADDRVVVSNSPSLNFGPGQDFSIEAWVRPQVSSTAFGIMSIVDKRLAPNIVQGQGYEFCLVDGRVTCRLSDSIADIGTGYGPAGPDLRDGNFHHVAMTVDRESPTGGRLYVDGQVVLVFDPTVEPGDLSNGEPLRIGNHATPSLFAYFKGAIDEVALYNRALATNEVAAIFAAGSAGKCAPPPPPCVPAADNLVSWWRAEDDAKDTADGNHGVLQGDVTFAPGKVGRAFAFAGTNASVNIPASSSLNVGAGGGFSLEAWIKPSTVALERPIVEWNSVTGGNPYPYGVHLWISVPVGYGAGPGCLYANIVDTAGGFHWLTSAGGLINTNVFQHVALTYNKATGLAVLYLNGAVVAEKNLGSFTPQTSYNLFLGRRPGGVAAAYSWAGLMDEVSLYARALGPAEIRAIYNADRAGKCPPPPPNHPPVADASATVPWLIVPAGCPPTVVLDGSRSSDPDGDSLQYRWFKAGETNPIATGAVAEVTLPLGIHAITLVVDDGRATASQTFGVELISPAQAVERLIALVNARARRPQPLLATLSAALAALERGNVTPALNQLEAFQNKVQAQVAPDDPVLAGQLIQAAQDLLDALGRDCASTKPAGRIGRLNHHSDGRVTMAFSAPDGQVYAVEASTNLVDWERIGVAVQTGPGVFEFEDPAAARLPARFYRLVIP